MKTIRTTFWIHMIAVTTIAVLALAPALAKEDDTEAGANKARAGERKKATAEAKEAREAKQEAAREAREAKREEATQKREAAVDKREDNQAKRIQHGINKGYLTAEETQSLKAQQASIGALEDSLKADTKLTAAERKTLEKELNEASHTIWAEKHDAEGNQMATYRLGKNVFAKDSLTSQMANENLNGAEAKALLKTFHRTVELKRALAGDLSADQRSKLQAEYDDLLNQNFEVR